MAIKRFAATLACVCVLLSAAAGNKDLERGVTLVSYEQTWRDSEATLALKNNTDEEIEAVKFLVKYLDMEGNEMDYGEYEEAVSIAPGMTRKVNIAAYEHGRCYYYYESEGLRTMGQPFKVAFLLQDYRTASGGEESGAADVEDLFAAGAAGMAGVAVVLVILSFVGYIALFVLVAVMAKKRGREVALWVLLSLFTTPVLVAIILLVIGDSDAERRNGYDAERRR